MTARNRIASLGYVRIAMRDPGEWASVGEEILGFRAEPQTNGSIHLRMDSAPARFIVEQAAQDGFICAGWECSSADYPVLISSLAEHGVSLETGSPDECAARAVDALVRGADASGNVFEVFHGRRSADSGFQSPIDGVEFVADDLGLGHLVLPAAEHGATSAFYRQVFGFGMSDELTLPPPVDGAPEMCIHFLHARSPRHHSLGLFNGPAPSGVVHLMVEMTTLDAVGACLDRVNAAGLPITATLGRHVNDGMVSFYFLAPGGIPVEVGYDGRQYDWDDFVPTRSTVGDLWGHAYSFPE
ncbi:MAG: VOC family protein [Gammaproteobacteria bacterium]|nr:VOC family protein [Gammaproteobacteria bacterium]